MKKTFLKMMTTLAILAFAKAAIAQNDCCQPCYEETPSCCDETPSTGEPTTPGYNAPARVDIACGWDVFLTGSFLYWQAREKGTDLGFHFYTETVDGSTYNHANVINMDFDFHPAFKIGLGWSLDRDDWNMYLEYTRLHCKNHRSFNITDTASTNHLESLWTHPLDIEYTDYSYTKYSSNTWKLNLNLIDLEIGRPYYVGKKLTFAPHYGIRSGWINQKYHLHAHNYNSDGDAYINLYADNKSDSWLLGPRAGLDTQWMLSENFRAFGDAAASLFYQHFKTHITQWFPVQLEEGHADYAKAKNKKGYLNPNVEFCLGFGYGTYFADNAWGFDVSAGYDFHYFWNQNTIRNVNDNQNAFHDHKPGDLMLHGLTITARLDF